MRRACRNGVTFTGHYTVSAACAPSRASLLTGHYPSLHGVTQTDGMAKSADSEDMFWLAPDGIPTMGTGSGPAATGRLQGQVARLARAPRRAATARGTMQTHQG